MRLTSSDEIIEIAHGVLFRLGGRELRDGRISWAPADGAYEPINCYLLLEGRRGLLIDTGVAAHEEVILEQLASLLPNDCQLSIFLTRAELDCMGNLSAIADCFPLDCVYTGGVVNPFDTFDHATSLVQETVRFERGSESSRIRLDEQRYLTILQPRLRLLTTFWVYDELTMTMFTSDAVGHVAASGPTSAAMSDSCTEVDPSLVETHLNAKFDWLAQCSGIDAVTRGVADAFMRYPTHVIAPTHGCVLFGEACVQTHVDTFLGVLNGYSEAGRFHGQRVG